MKPLCGQIGLAEHHMVARTGFAPQYLLGDGIFDGALQGAAHRTGAKTRIVAGRNDFAGGGFGQLDRDVLRGKRAVDLADHEFDDLEQLRLVKRAEQHNLIETVQQLGLELAA